MKKTFTFHVNETEKEVLCHPAKTLLEVLRDDLGFTASKELRQGRQQIG